MIGGEIPEVVERLLARDIESYEQLEALRLLVKDPHQPLAVDDMSRMMGIAEDSVLEALHHLRQRGLVESTTAAGRPAFRYGQPPDLDQAVRALMLLYQEKPVEIGKRMTANSIERVRTAAIRTFSDAFLLRRKKDDG